MNAIIMENYCKLTAEAGCDQGLGEVNGYHLYSINQLFHQ